MISQLPKIPISRIAVKVKSAAERKIRQRHPWVFNESITKESQAPQTGDMAIIYDNKSNKFLALGLYDCESPIRIKVIQFSKSAQIDQEWFDSKVSSAFEIRESLLSTATNSYRLLFGEADGLPGVICDVYNGNAVLKLYSGAWFSYLELLCNALVNVIEPQCILLRLSRSLTDSNLPEGLADELIIYGELPEEDVQFEEHGVTFSANLVKGHKTGFFLDHRANRKRVGELSNKKTVLDVFSYAGGFSVHALAGGAASVLSVDISKPALELALKNSALNEFTGEHHIEAGDAFRILDRLARDKEKFDVVVIDPPSFAKQKTEVENALKQYDRLARLGAELVATDGVLVLASCSSRISKEAFFLTVDDALRDSKGRFEIMEETFHDTDHPTLDHFTEGQYLKCVYYKRVY